jgi:membrane-associated PAP2 superfamily phosphatase
MSLNRQIVLSFLVLLVAIVFFGMSDIDLLIQDSFYIPQTKQWVLNSYMEPYNFIFYNGIKKLLIVFAVLLFFGLFASLKISWLKNYREGIIIVLLSAIIIPLSVGMLKKETNMPCPKQEIQYGGFYPRTAVWESYPDDFFLKPYRSKCWPAGHASGGFALMSLFFLFKKKKNRIIALIIGVIIGWSMGIYKMLIGDHFFSHTVITMILAWFLIAVIAKTTYTLYRLK